MTFRVWPAWVRLLPVALGLAAVFAVGYALGARPPGPGLELPWGDGEDGRPAASERQRGWTARPAAVPILMYHHLDEVGSRYAVTPAQFARHLAYLRDGGYEAITVGEYLAALDGAGLPPKPVMITVDDGFADQWGFVEGLREFGMSGNFFLPNTATLDPEQLRAVREVGDVGGHTVSHPFLSDLGPAEQAEEIGANRAWVEAATGVRPAAFAYPFGDSDAGAVAAVRAAGYVAAFDAWGGPAPVDPGVDRWHIPRIEVSGEDDLATFAAKLGGADL